LEDVFLHKALLQDPTTIRDRLSRTTERPIRELDDERFGAWLARRLCWISTMTDEQKTELNGWLRLMTEAHERGLRPVAAICIDDETGGAEVIAVGDVTDVSEFLRGVADIVEGGDVEDDVHSVQ